MTIFSQLIEIILLKRRPQDLDFDQAAAVLYLVLTIGINYISTSMSGAFSHPLMISAVQNLAIAGLLFAFLGFSGKGQRFIQTCTAMFGINAILSLVILFLAQVPVINLLIVVLMGWSFYLMVLVLRDAFDASLLKAVFLLIGINIIAVFFTTAVVPGYIEEFQALMQANQAV